MHNKNINEKLLIKKAKGISKKIIRISLFLISSISNSFII